MRIVVDRGTCIGLGRCEAEVPDLFAVGEDGSLAVLDETPAADHWEALDAAVEACPTDALSIVEG